MEKFELCVYCVSPQFKGQIDKTNDVLKIFWILTQINGLQSYYSTVFSSYKKFCSSSLIIVCYLRGFEEKYSGSPIKKRN